MASPEPSATAAGEGGSSASQAQAAAVEPIRMPTVEEIKGQDIWINCAVRSVVSGVMEHPRRKRSQSRMAPVLEPQRTASRSLHDNRIAIINLRYKKISVPCGPTKSPPSVMPPRLGGFGVQEVKCVEGNSQTS